MPTGEGHEPGCLRCPEFGPLVVIAFVESHAIPPPKHLLQVYWLHRQSLSASFSIHELHHVAAKNIAAPADTADAKTGPPRLTQRVLPQLQTVLDFVEPIDCIGHNHSR